MSCKSQDTVLSLWRGHGHLAGMSNLINVCVLAMLPWIHHFAMITWSDGPWYTDVLLTKASGQEVWSVSQLSYSWWRCKLIECILHLWAMVQIQFKVCQCVHVCVWVDCNRQFVVAASTVSMQLVSLLRCKLIRLTCWLAMGKQGHCAICLRKGWSECNTLSFASQEDLKTRQRNTTWRLWTGCPQYYNTNMNRHPQN